MRNLALVLTLTVTPLLAQSPAPYRITHTYPLGGDGIIYDTEAEQAWPTEHVMVPSIEGESSDAGTLILKKIAQKQNKFGAPYAGKTLIADIARSTAAPGSDANDLERTLGLISI